MTTHAPAPALPDDAYVGGLAYHRLVFARRRTGWWTPLIVGLVGVGFYAALIVIIVITIMVAGLLVPDFGTNLLSVDVTGSFDLADPFMLAVLLGTIVLMLPAYLAASRLINGPRLGLVSSAAGRIRWGWLLACTGLAIAVTAVVQGLSMLLPSDPFGESSAEVLAPADNPMFGWTLLVLIVSVPFQAAAEEYVFRGYLMQALGRWLRHPIWAIVLPIPLFVLGHVYDVLGQASVAVFALVAGWLTWRTGGLEAAIAIHIVNNLVAFGMAAFGLADVNASGQGVLSLVSSVVMIAGYALVVDLVFRRRRMPRVLRFPAPPAPPAAALPGYAVISGPAS